MILHCLRLARPADEADLSDLTASTRTAPARWVECEEHGASNCLLLPLDPEPSDPEATAIRRRLVTSSAEDEARLADITAALQDPDIPTWARLTLQSELARYDEPPG